MFSVIFFIPCSLPAINTQNKVCNSGTLFYEVHCVLTQNVTLSCKSIYKKLSWRWQMWRCYSQVYIRIMGYLDNTNKT